MFESKLAACEEPGRQLKSARALFDLWIDAGEPATHIHLAFLARDRETVERFHRAGLAAGGRDNGGPGERPYHPGYFAAFLWDPDGNNIEAVYHGPAERSAESVVFTFEMPKG